MGNENVMNKATRKTAIRILSVSLATASLLAGATSALGSIAAITATQANPTPAASVLGAARTLPAQLVLRPATSNPQLVAQHDSHSSHASHASHASHSSHASGL